MPPEQAFRTPEQIASRTGLSRKAIYRAVERGQLTAYRLCGRLRIRPEDEDAWINANRVPVRGTSLESHRPLPRPARASHSLRRLLKDEDTKTGHAAA